MELKLKSGGKLLIVPNVKEVKGLRNFKGLMFTRREKAGSLLFNIKSSLHSYFVFFPFVVLWLDNSNKILDKKIVRPFTFYINSNENYSKILEIPFNRRYNYLIKSVVGERFKKN